MLPYQSPLYNAFEALKAKDLKEAESEIQRFFIGLESDLIAVDYRRHDFERQIFEANVVGVLLTEEIDAWWVLSAIKMQQRDWQGALANCYRQIELIDRHYGFASPSWQCPETRIPRDRELADRYFRLASDLAIICLKLDEAEMSGRWTNVTSTSTCDRVDPENVWARWVAEAGDDFEPAVSTYYFLDWSIKKIEVDGKSWLVNLNSALPERATPRSYSTLAKVHVETNPTFDVPSKATRWRIWSLRQAIAARFKRHHAGIYFGELQCRGERVLLYYATSEEDVRRLTAPILEAAAELSPRLEIQEDPRWREYSKWGGRSIIVDAPSSQLPAAVQLEHENDLFLRLVWEECQSISGVWTKMFTLLEVVNVVPPQEASMRNYCFEYFFELVTLLTDQERDSALWYMVWKLSRFAPDVAVRALDMVRMVELSDDHQCLANLAAEALANAEPERALSIIEVLKKHRYTLVCEALGKIAVSIGRTDQARAKEIIAETREYILEFGEQSAAKASYLTKLAVQVHPCLPVVARELLSEVACLIKELDHRSAQASGYLELAGAVKKVAPDLLQPICRDALESAFALMAPAQYWLDSAGPRAVVNHICWLVPYLSLSNKTMALEVLAQATDITCELEDFEMQLNLLPSLAEAAASFDLETNRALVNRLWTILESQRENSKLTESSFLHNRRSAVSPGPVELFVKMNPPLAAERLASIIVICQMAVLPERQVDLLCSFAAAMPNQLDCAKSLILQAASYCRHCSSAFLRAIAWAQVAGVMHALGLDTGPVCQEIISSIDSIGSPNMRLGTLLEAVKKCAANYPELANRLLEKAVEISPQVNDVSSFLMGQLDGLPQPLSSQLFFMLLKRRKDDNPLLSQLRSFASGLPTAEFD